MRKNTVSNRQEYLLLLPVNISADFIYSATSLWFTLLTCWESLIIKDFTVGLGCLKSKLKDVILCRHKRVMKMTGVKNQILI